MDNRTVYVAGMIAFSLLACGFSTVVGLIEAINHCQAVAKQKLASPVLESLKIQQVHDACAVSERMGKSVSTALR